MKKRITAFLLSAFMICMAFINSGSQVHAEGNTKTRIMITSYSVSDEVGPGDDFDLTFTVKNTSPVNNAYSILLTLSSSAETIYPVYGESDQVYIESLAPNQEQEVTVRLEAAAALEMFSVDYIIGMSYFDEVEGTTSNQSTIQIPIGQKSLLVVQNYTVAEKATVGAKSRISVNYQNMGVEELNNVVLHVSVNGEAGQIANIGDVATGEINNKEVYYEYSKAGEQEVSIVMTYSDGEGNEYKTDEILTKVNVSESTVVQNTESTTGNNGNGSLLSRLTAWQILVILGILVLLVVVIVLVRKDKNK